MAIIKELGRRNLLKLLPALPAVAMRTQDGRVAAAEVTPRFFMLFVDHAAVNPDSFSDAPAPDGVEVLVVPVRLREGQKIEDVVRMYETSAPIPMTCLSGDTTKRE